MTAVETDVLADIQKRLTKLERRHAKLKASFKLLSRVGIEMPELTAEQIAEIERREALSDADPSRLIPADVVFARLLGRTS